MSEQGSRDNPGVENISTMIRAEAFYRIMSCHPGEYQNWFRLLNGEAQDGAYGMSAGAAALIAIDVNLAHRRREEKQNAQ